MKTPETPSKLILPRKWHPEHLCCWLKYTTDDVNVTAVVRKVFYSNLG